MNGKKLPVKATANSRPRIEYAGKNIVSNFWVKIGFSREELGALRQITRLFENRKHQTVGNCAMMVLETALMHWDKLEPLVFADQKYAKDEGFKHLEFFRAKTIAIKFNLHGARRALPF
jgi:hypothetical protein